MGMGCSGQDLLNQGDIIGQVTMLNVTIGNGHGQFKSAPIMVYGGWGRVGRVGGGGSG